MSAGTVTAEQAARALVDRAKEVALCLDFDGTLSPVVDDPEAARPLQGVVEMLGPLASRFAAVAIISGRPAAYLGEHGAAPGVRYLGCTGCRRCTTAGSGSTRGWRRPAPRSLTCLPSQR